MESNNEVPEDNLFERVQKCCVGMDSQRVATVCLLIGVCAAQQSGLSKKKIREWVYHICEMKKD